MKMRLGRLSNSSCGEEALIKDETVECENMRLNIKEKIKVSAKIHTLYRHKYVITSKRRRRSRSEMVWWVDFPFYLFWAVTWSENISTSILCMLTFFIFFFCTLRELICLRFWNTDTTTAQDLVGLVARPAPSEDNMWFQKARLQ